MGMSKSWTVRRNAVPASPVAAKVAATNSVTGSARIAHGERIRPSTTMSTSMLTAYSVARMSAHSISPIAISPIPMGVARIPS